MKMMGKELIRALLAAALALVLTVSFGSLLGYAVNPTAARESQKEILAFARANPVVTSAQNDAFYTKVAAKQREPAPPAVLAITQLMGALTLLALLLLRPQRTAATILGVLAAVLLWLVAGAAPAIAFAVASLAYLVVASMFSGLRRVAA